MQVKSDYVQASSGHIGACLVPYLGGKKIILSGFECQALDGETHGHRDYKMHDFGPFEERFIPGWKNLAPRFRELGVEIINSTPDSKIKEFKFMPLKKAISYV
jgi:hypothetical protein